MLNGNTTATIKDNRKIRRFCSCSAVWGGAYVSFIPSAKFLSLDKENQFSYAVNKGSVMSLYLYLNYI